MPLDSADVYLEIRSNVIGSRHQKTAGEQNSDGE
jgi:hypothetical protein